MTTNNKLICSECGATLVRGSSNSDESCWCAAYPAVIAVEQKQDCLCANCLGSAVQAKITEFIDKSSQGEAIAAARKYRGNNKLIEGIDYLIENDKYVFTQWYHLKRGSCCGNSCKNCPY